MYLLLINIIIFHIQMNSGEILYNASCATLWPEITASEISSAVSVPRSLRLEPVWKTVLKR